MTCGVERPLCDRRCAMAPSRNKGEARDLILCQQSINSAIHCCSTCLCCCNSPWPAAKIRLNSEYPAAIYTSTAYRIYILCQWISTTNKMIMTGSGLGYYILVIMMELFLIRYVPLDVPFPLRFLPSWWLNPLPFHSYTFIWKNVLFFSIHITIF